MSRTLIDLTGRRFGMLVVLNRAGSIQKNTQQPTWLCQCDCGRQSVVMGANLRTGLTRSCGCLKKHNSTTHGMTDSPEYQSWRGMIARCTDPKNSHYANYGGRGVKVCKRWLKFENFFADMGRRPPGTSLDRFPNHNGDYKPSNCRWATAAEQSRNTTRSVKIKFKGRTMCRKDWATEIGITDGALANRLRKYPLHVAMTARKGEL